MLEQMKGLLCSAIEGGSNYWCTLEKHNRKDVGKEFVHEAPFEKDGFLIVSDRKSGEEPQMDEPFSVNLESLEKGWEIFKEKYPSHYADVLKENDDAETGDVYLQCVVFGELIYG